MKILLFAPGKSSHTHKWARFYQEQGIQVKVATFKSHFSPEHASEIDTVCLPKWLPGKLSYFTCLHALREILQKWKPDLLHAHYLSSYGFVGALLDFHPFIVSVWGSDVYQFPQKSGLNRWIVQFALRKADGICSTSRAMAKEIEKYTDKPIEITPFGVDLNLFQPAPVRKKSEQVTIGIAKGLKDIYGFPELFQAFAKIADEFPQTHLLIVGDGPERARYEKMVMELGIQGRVEFVGYVENTRLSVYLNQMDLFVLPSHQESFGVAAIEAQACGIPVIANGIGGLPEVVQDGETGILLPNNHPDTIYEAIKKLILNKELRIKMGMKGVQFVKEHYNWIENANRMIHLYQIWTKDGGRR